MHTIFTIGHSTRHFEELTQPLLAHGVTLLIDVRARPQSRFYPHFNRKYLEANLQMKYLWLGDKLGGKNANEIAKEEFDSGIDRVIELAESETVCLMCSEGSPTPTKWRPEGCHRWHTLAPALEKKGMTIAHL